MQRIRQPRAVPGEPVVGAIRVVVLLDKPESPKGHPGSTAARLNSLVSVEQKPKDEGKSMWKDPVFLATFVGSSLLFAGLGFGFLHMLTALPVWACVLIALPVGVLVFLLLLWLQICSDAPQR